MQLIESYRDIFISLSGGTVSSTLTVEVAKSYTPARVHYILELLADLTADLRNSQNKRLSFEVSVAKITRPDTDALIDSLNARLSDLEKRVNSGNVGSSTTNPKTDTASNAATNASDSVDEPAIHQVEACASQVQEKKDWQVKQEAKN